MKKNIQSEFGQSIYIIALGMVALLGFTALSVDGGRIYLDRRRAQNAADQAVMASALAKVEGYDWLQIGLDRAADNEFNNDGITNFVSIYSPPISGLYSGDEKYVQTFITAESETSLIQFFYGGETKVTVEAVARIQLYNAALTSILNNHALVTVGNCASSSGHSLDFTGGGNSGGIVTIGGGIFLNSSETPGGCCALEEPNNGYGIVSGGPITSIGTCDYAGSLMTSPIPIITGFNHNQPIVDPLAGLPEPECPAPGTKSGNNYSPGSWDASDFSGGTVILAPGIHCISGEVKMSGGETIFGEGVLLYFTDTGETSFTGNSSMHISAPTELNCLGSVGNVTDSCNYVGMVVFMARSNTLIFETGGNGTNSIYGTVYALNSSVQAHGGGTLPGEVDVVGQVITKNMLGNGNGSYTIEYDVNWVFPPLDEPPYLEMTQ
jgi:hypothetical protein